MANRCPACNATLAVSTRTCPACGATQPHVLEPMPVKGPATRRWWRHPLVWIALIFVLVLGASAAWIATRPAHPELTSLNATGSLLTVNGLELEKISLSDGQSSRLMIDGTTRFGPFAHLVSWAPDSTRFLQAPFFQDSQEDVAIYALNSDLVVPVEGYDFSGQRVFSSDIAWASDSSKIALILHQDDNPSLESKTIVVIDVATATASVLVSADELNSSSLAWSPDGAQLLATVTLTDTPRLVVFDTTMPMPQPLPAPLAKVEATTAWWLSDARIGFEGDCHTPTLISLCVYDLSTGALTTLITDFSRHRFDGISPDRQWLMIYYFGNDLRLYHVPSGEWKMIVDVNGQTRSLPEWGVWSPDSQFFTYSDPNGVTALYSLADGTTQPLPSDVEIIGWMP